MSTSPIEPIAPITNATNPISRVRPVASIKNDDSDDDDKVKPPFSRPRQDFKVLLVKDIDNRALYQSRKHPISGRDLADFADSIRSNGLKQPIVVTPTNNERGKPYRIVSGRTRLDSMASLGTKSVQCVVEYYDHPAQEALSNLIENLLRTQLSAYEICEALLRARNLGLTDAQIAYQLKKPVAWVSSNANTVDRLIPQLKDVFRQRSDETTVKQLKEIARLPAGEQQAEFDKYIGKVDVAAKAAGADKVARGEAIMTDLVMPRLPGEKEKSDDESRMRSKKKIESFVFDAKKAQAFRVGSKTIDLDEKGLLIAQATAKWILGEIKDCPLVMPKESKESKASTPKKAKAGAKKS